MSLERRERGDPQRDAQRAANCHRTILCTKVSELQVLAPLARLISSGEDARVENLVLIRRSRSGRGQQSQL